MLLLAKILEMSQPENKGNEEENRINSWVGRRETGREGGWEGQRETEDEGDRERGKEEERSRNSWYHCSLNPGFQTMPEAIHIHSLIFLIT